MVLLVCSLCLFAGVVCAVLLPAAKTVFSAQKPGASVWIIDPGHGGEDGGAVSANGDRESDINLAIAERLNLLFGFLGQQTVMTRREDLSIYSDGAETLRQKKTSDLKNRVSLANSTPGGILISIHQNSLPRVPSVHGAQVFFGGAERSEEIAASVQGALNESVNAGNEKQEKRIDPSVYLMKKAECPAILVECGFMTNAGEVEKLKDPAYQKTLAVVIAAGALRTHGEKEE